jgi:hypothetical protein
MDQLTQIASWLPLGCLLLLLLQSVWRQLWRCDVPGFDWFHN